MANGWTPERRAKHAAAIQNWKPWERSSGPKTDVGKASVSANARKHGMRSQEARALQEAITSLLAESLPLEP